MTEYEIFLPGSHNDGTPVAPEVLAKIKEQLVGAFGGYTHLTHRSEGAWRIGGVTFRDEITLLKVLDDGSANFDMAAFKEELKKVLRQEEVLIVQREVAVV